MRRGHAANRSETAALRASCFPVPDGLAAPDTATVDRLPLDEASLLANFVQNTGDSDGVSRDAPDDPTATLAALAVAGRNPTDITVPTIGTAATARG